MSKKRLLAGLLAATMTLSCFTGCSTVTKSDLKGEMKDIAACTYGSDTIYLDEVNYYLRNTQISFEYYYSMYGMSDVWSDDSAVDSLFEETLATIYQTKVLNDYAKENNITLTEEEEKKVTETVDSVAEATDHPTVTAGQDKDMLTKIFTENAIANKAYYTITEATEIQTKEEDCVKNAVEYILFNEADETISAEDTEEEEAETAETVAPVVYTEADANAALDQVKSGEDMEKVAEKYSLNVSVGNFNPKDEQSTEMAKAAAQMKKGDAQVVYEEGQGWYLLSCTSDKDEDSSQSAYETAVEEEKEAHFKEVYEAMAKQKFKPEDAVVKSLDVKNTPMLVTETEEAADTVAETE